MDFISIRPLWPGVHSPDAGASFSLQIRFTAKSSEPPAGVSASGPDAIMSDPQWDGSLPPSAGLAAWGLGGSSHPKFFLPDVGKQ
jgi:hypothetical protein